jgi:peptide/nickel transport system ATP-binding protein
MLEVENLTVTFDTADGPLSAVSDVSFAIASGETLALVGESGSGKTVTGLAIARLLPRRGVRIGGRIRLAGADLLSLGPGDLRRVRGRRVAYVFQEPLTAINPVIPIGALLSEALIEHHGCTRQSARTRSIELLTRVGIPEPEHRARQYVHQLSGGMRQRVMIALAISGEPELLVADEPTTALDATVQAQILDLLRDLAADRGMAMLFVSHDLGVVADIAQRIAVLYAGRLVESGPAVATLARPMMPYTQGLLNSLPEAGDNRRLAAIPGQPPDPYRRPVGCTFAPRCAARAPICDASEPPLRTVEEGRQVRCARWPAIGPSPRSTAADGIRPHSASEVLLDVQGLIKHFPVAARTMFGVNRVVRAVDGVSLSVRKGEALGLVGESGSGKTTIGRCILRLIEPTEGTIRFRGGDITHLPERKLRALRPAIQVVFQDPFASLNPLLSVERIVGDAAVVHGLVERRKRSERVRELLDLVGLSPEHAGRRPHEFSGGQRQRIAIARALALEPEMIVADEAVSALDVSIRAQIINLFQDLRARLSLSLLFISHDLALVRHLCERVVVVYLGRVMESGPAEDVLTRPAHPYSKALASAAPTLDPARRQMRIVLQGDVPSPIDPPSGCVFRTRCPHAVESCARQVPELREVSPGRFSACLFDF